MRVFLSMVFPLLLSFPFQWIDVPLCFIDMSSHAKAVMACFDVNSLSEICVRMILVDFPETHFISDISLYHCMFSPSSSISFSNCFIVFSK